MDWQGRISVPITEYIFAPIREALREKEMKAWREKAVQDTIKEIEKCRENMHRNSR